MIMKVDPVGQGQVLNTKIILNKVRYCGRLPGAEAASVCDSTIIHEDA